MKRYCYCEKCKQFGHRNMANEEKDILIIEADEMTDKEIQQAEANSVNYLRNTEFYQCCNNGMIING